MLPESCCSNPWYFSRLYEQSLWQTSCSHSIWSNHNVLQCNIMKVSKCPCIFHCTVSFEEYKHLLNLPPKVLQMFLGKHIIKMCNEHLKSVKNTLLINRAINRANFASTAHSYNVFIGIFHLVHTKNFLKT